MGTGVGGRIRIARLNNGWTQDELATRMGKTKSLISKVENGLDNLTSDKIGEYADALNVKPAELMGWDEAKTIELKEIYSKKKAYKMLCRNDKLNAVSAAIRCGGRLHMGTNTSGDQCIGRF